MKDGSLKEYSEAFHRDIASDADALEMLREHAFVEKMTEILVDYGETGECEPCHWQAKGLKVDAYAFDEEYANLVLVVSHWLDEPDPVKSRVTSSGIDKLLKRGRSFFAKSLDGRLRDRIDVSNPAHDLSGIIHECRKDILSVKVVLVTDGTTPERQAVSEVLDGIEVKNVVWDIQRAHAFEKTGEREQIFIDFESDYGGAIPCVEQPSPNGKYTTYLAFVPGSVLADLYADWKIRLLERNVRVFLSHRPKVNQGIRDTIREEPDMFCAYNNGITVYAQNVKMSDLGDGRRGISQVMDFQIVNGGQTTASLYHTRQKHKADLSMVSVQMKLMLINDEAKPRDLPAEQRLSDVLVPKIGRFSNTQNRVQLADLLANDPPHPELHAISRNLAAPDPTGGSVQTYWFYEKARGSYEETRRLEARTRAQQKKFDRKYPRRQRFDKGKFGKAWNSYRKQPNVVCLGAMKNFARFNAWLQELEDEDWQAFFRKTAALVMMWNEAERIVRRQKFGGYRHAIVTYTLAWLHQLTDLRLDLDKIWHEQRMDDSIPQAIELLCVEVNDRIRDTDLNVTEWCKKEDCWTGLLGKDSPDLPDMKEALLSRASRKRYDDQAKSEIQNIEFCKEKGPQAWFALAKWLKDRNFMQGKQRSQSFNMGRCLARGKKDPSAVLAYACRRIWEKAESGFGWSPDGEAS